MSAETPERPAVQFVIPPMYGDHAEPVNGVETSLYVLAFLRDFMGGYNNDHTMSDEAMYGFTLILDAVIDNLNQAHAKL